MNRLRCRPVGRLMKPLPSRSPSRSPGALPDPCLPPPGAGPARGLETAAPLAQPFLPIRRALAQEADAMFPILHDAKRRAAAAASSLFPWVAVVAGLLGPATAALATEGGPPMPGASAPAPADTAADALLSMRLAAAEAARMAVDRDEPGDGGGPKGSGEHVVKGAPYCAEAVHETIQWLPDPAGAAPNRIVRQNVTRLCRDGEGRTRQEVERGGRRYVYLRDPAAREGWVLDAERKTARRLGSVSLPLGAAADAASWRDYAEQMREWARKASEAARAQARAAAMAAEAGGTPPALPMPPVPAPPPHGPVPSASPAPAAPAAPVPLGAATGLPVPPVPAVIARSERAGGSREGSEVTVLRMERDREAPRWDLAPPPAVQWRATHLSPRGAGTTTALPARDVDGVRVHGERTTWVIEAGRVGNERPIQIVREVWTAPELLLTVSSRDFDPRTGEVVYRLRNLKRGEPDAALMRVPADYTRQERGGSRGRPGGEGGAASAPRG